MPCLIVAKFSPSLGPSGGGELEADAGCRSVVQSTSNFVFWLDNIELELELIQTQMAQKQMLRAEVRMRVRCANKASAE